MLEKAESLFSKLEEKLVGLLSARDDLASQNQLLAAENEALKAEKELHSKKLHELVTLLESVNEPQPHVNANANTNTEHFSPSLAAIKPLMAQGQA